MQIKFKSLVIEGFRSIVDEQSFNLEQPGLNMVKGTNGKGKTTLFEALIWCLYGANLKGTVSAKVQTWKELRDKSYQGTCVVTPFTVGEDNYQILRAIKHKEHGDSLIVTKNGERIPELDKKDTQLYIDELLTMDFNTFMNSFMFGQRMTRLVEAQSSEKRKLFEELFDMEWIQNMRDKAVSDKTDAEREVLLHEQALSLKQLSIGNYEDSIEEAKARLDEQQRDEDNFKEDIDHDIHDNQEIYESLVSKKMELKMELNDLPTTADGSLEDNTTEITNLEYRISNVEEAIGKHERELTVLESKRQMKQGELDNYDSSLYDTHLSTIAKVEGQMKDIMVKLFPGDDGAGLLTEEEQMEITHEYEGALGVYNTAQDKFNDLQRQVTAEPETFCWACKRPFDNVGDIEEHTAAINDALEVASLTMAAEKTNLDMARDDAKLLYEYQKLEQSLKVMEANQPKDPEEAKKLIDRTIGTFAEEEGAIKVVLTDANKEANELTDRLDELDNKQRLYDAQAEKIRVAKAEQAELQGKLDRILLDMQQAQDRITKLVEDKKITKMPQLRAELASKTTKLMETNEAAGVIEVKLGDARANLEVINFWVKDVFASNGMKAYIFKAMLDQLNQYTAKYGNKLGCSMKFSLDLTKVSAPFSTICTLGDKVNKDYREFSGGERTRLDIVLLMSMHDLLSSSTELNILILDEVFENLDEEGVSAVFELLGDKAKEKSIFVISHSPVLDTLHSNTIEIDQVEGKTILP